MNQNFKNTISVCDLFVFFLYENRKKKLFTQPQVIFSFVEHKISYFEKCFHVLSIQ